MGARCTQQEMERRLVRYRELRPCLNAFIDTRTPGSERKENFTIIGPGVSENPEQHVHIKIPHGFNIGGARQPPHCVNSQHAHETAEVFVVHAGRWAFRWGKNADDGEVLLGAGDTISIPVNVFRGFENVGDGDGYLFAILGGDDPGRVTWAPAVFKMAEDYGLVLLENGRLVDTTRGETVPVGVAPQPPTTDAQADALRRMSESEMRECVAFANDLSARGGDADGGDGVEECAVIGADARLNWPHGFRLARIRLQGGATKPAHAQDFAEVFFVHRGRMQFDWEDGSVTLSAGDVLTLPKNLQRSWKNPGDAELIAYAVRGGDQP